jgi:hypothetical protein
MHAYITVVYRTAPIATGGYLAKVDLDSKRVLAKTPIVPQDPLIPDPNPRGGTRGGRGILVDGDEVYVASYHTIHVFDSDLRPIRQFSNPLFADIHDLTWDGEYVWASSTALDLAVKVDKQGGTVEVWSPREDPVVADRFQLGPLPLDLTQDNRLTFLGVAQRQPGHSHLNTVSMLNGRPAVLLNSFGCVAQLNPTRVIIADPAIRGAHNLVGAPDGSILICNTHDQSVWAYDETGRLRRRIRLAEYPEVRRLQRRFAWRRMRVWLAEHSPSYRLSILLADGEMRASRPLFVRGLCLTGRGSFLVGISPASILEIDLQDYRLRGFHQFSDIVHESIQDVECGLIQPSAANVPELQERRFHASGIATGPTRDDP